MQKILSTFIAISLLSTTPGILLAEDNIQFSDDYFEIKASEDETPQNQINNQIAKNGSEGILSIKPSPNWNLQRDRENALIEEVSFNENYDDGIITQNGVELAKSTTDVMQSGDQNSSNSDSTNNSISLRDEDIKRDHSLPKTLKVRPESQPEDEEPIVESNLGDWVFDFPK
ncbi:MAG: hypothetical protein ACQ9MH_02455 [Nitrospinales bacterium]